MNSVCKDIFQAIHEGKWLKIEYKNVNDEITNYWIGIRSIDPRQRSLQVEGLHLSRFTIGSYDKIFIDSILKSEVIDGSYYPKNEVMIEDISLHPEKYLSVFDQFVNLKLLNYLEMCNRLDCCPYLTDYDVIQYLDQDRVFGTEYQLSDEQFAQIVKSFQFSNDKKEKTNGGIHLKQLAMNVLSIHTPKGLYVLAYKQLKLDVKRKVLKPAEEITVCSQFTVNGYVESIRKYLDADEYELVNDFEKNQEKIKDLVMKNVRKHELADDTPYILAIGMDVVLDLKREYRGITDMYEKHDVTYPIKAFFGEVLGKPRSSRVPAITLLNNRANLDQILAINQIMKQPCAYIQGPPGTGKTNTIVNTLVTAFFNEKSVLFVSYNNIPIDNVVEKLSSIEYRGNIVPFPILRVGNRDKMIEAIQTINRLRERVAKLTIYESTLDRRKKEMVERSQKLSALLRGYALKIDLEERKDSIYAILEHQKGSLNLSLFESNLKNQINKIDEKLERLGSFSEEDALALLDYSDEEFFKYLFYTSAKYIKRLEEDAFSELRIILDNPNVEESVTEFQKYLSKSDHIELLQKVFPIMVTTCISAHKLGSPEPLFDMTIMDEASQCNVAMGLVPIIRGRKLMLVGDPQQLNPVILLDASSNTKLKQKYHISDEYDYRSKSIYKTYIACDAISEEILLHNHYRCHEKIINFNNIKYYNSQLRIKSQSVETDPLVFIDMKQSTTPIKNASYSEVQEIVNYAIDNSDQSIAVITPFVSQKELIDEEIGYRGLKNVVCGTVHSFQGDEKDVVLFSTAITDDTNAGTYHWLKNNTELINVATSRAKNKLIVLANEEAVNKLHGNDDNDDLYELIQYVKSGGRTEVKCRYYRKIKPYDTDTEKQFLECLTLALNNMWMTQSKFEVKREVPVSQIFLNNPSYDDYFYKGRFDFVICQKMKDVSIPMLAIELDGKEHFEDDVVIERDKKKKQICEENGFELIHVENCYARRYSHIKEVLHNYFKKMH